MFLLFIALFISLIILSFKLRSPTPPPKQQQAKCHYSLPRDYSVNDVMLTVLFGGRQQLIQQNKDHNFH